MTSIVIIVTQRALPFERRGVEWDLTALPVPADVLVYTRDEWAALDRDNRFCRMLASDAAWVFHAAASGPHS